MIRDCITGTKTKNEKLHRDKIKNHEVTKLEIKNSCCFHILPLFLSYFSSFVPLKSHVLLTMSSSSIKHFSQIEFHMFFIIWNKITNHEVKNPCHLLSVAWVLFQLVLIFFTIIWNMDGCTNSYTQFLPWQRRS